MAQSFSPEPWMSSLTFWTSEMEEKSPDMMPNIATRLVQETSGLFDEGLVVGPDHISGNDLKLGEAVLGDSILDMSELDFGGLPADLDFDVLAEPSLDSFVDLNDYLMKEPVGESPLTQALEPERPSRKRPLASLSLDVEGDNAMDVVDMIGQACPSTPDHDYVTKKPRLAPSPVPSTSVAAEDFEAPTTPGDRYLERRRKNNIASRRSREVRKQKFVLMEEEADRLVEENAHLRVKIEKLEKLAKEMKAQLLAKLGSS